MSISTRYVLIASMDVTPEAEPLFNEVYDTEHVPNLLQVPGVHSVTRMKGEPARFAIAGAVRELPAPSPIYTAIYEIDHPQVLESPEWAEAVERGRWPSEVRPHTSNRQHHLFKVPVTCAGLTGQEGRCATVRSRGRHPCRLTARLAHRRASRCGSAHPRTADGAVRRREAALMPRSRH